MVYRLQVGEKDLCCSICMLVSFYCQGTLIGALPRYVFLQSGHVCVCVCTLHPSSVFQLPRREVLPQQHKEKYRKYKPRASNSSVSLTRVMERRPEPERERENNEQHTVSPKRHKCSNWRAGVTQMARHTQKVNYEAVERKRQLCRIWANTHVSAETVAAGMSLLSRSNKNPKTQTDPRTCVSRK